MARILQRLSGALTKEWKLPFTHTIQFRGMSSTECFNRTREINQLLTGLKDRPTLHVIAGPVNSGKTTVLMKLIESLREAHVPVLSIGNFQLHRFSYKPVDYTSLLNTFEETRHSWLTDRDSRQFSEAAEHFKLDIDTGGFVFKNLKVKNSDVEETNVPLATAPVFVIDDSTTNVFGMMMKDPDGQNAFHNLLKALEMSTKAQHFHVILASNDSFFHLRLPKYVDSTRYRTYVIGDLARDEAQNFWHWLKETKSSGLISAYQCSPPWPDFNDVYTVCGGNMFLIE